MISKIRLVIATRLSREDFFLSTPLGRMLELLPLPHIDVRLFPENTKGLPIVYNQATEESRDDPAILVFMHDDACFLDFWWWEQVASSVDKYDVVGLAGNRRRLPHQPAWAFTDQQFTWDSPENFSGVVAHGTGFPPANISIYGPPGQEVKLLDGLMLICRSETLIREGMRFDERFDFHFYDMDFCRQAESLNLKMGTWAISVIHQSAGRFGNEAWRRALDLYFGKWQS